MKSVSAETTTQLALFDNDSDVSIFVIPEERNELPHHPRDGLSMNLAKRAIYLLRAVDSLSEAEQKRGLAIAGQYDRGIQKRYSPAERESIVAREADARQDFVKNFRLAWGADEVLAHGEITHDSKEVGLDDVFSSATSSYAPTVNMDVSDDRNDFVNKTTGKVNEASRSKLRRQLKKQLGWAKII